METSPARNPRLRALQMAAAYGLVMAALYVLKPLRNAIFLEQVGVSGLPWALVAVAVAGAATALSYNRFATRARVDRVVLLSFVTIIAMLLASAPALAAAGPWLAFTFYVWVAIAGVISTSLVWLMANAIFDPREARRYFGLVGAGGILGATAGGLFTRLAVTELGTTNLLFVCAPLLGIALLLQWLAYSAARQDDASDSNRRARPTRAVARSEAGSTLESPLVRGLASMAAIAAVVAVIADIQFNHIVDRAFHTRAEQAAFFGEFYAYLNAAAFVFQLFITPRILAARGVGAALLFLPIALGLSSIALVAAPTLVFAIALKASDMGLRHSLHKSAVEVLYVPLADGLRRRARLLVDTTIETVATGLGAVAVVALTRGLGMSYASLGVVSIGLVVVWIVLGTRARKAYVETFRRAIERREIDPSELRTGVAEASTLRSLDAALAGSNERQIVYALEMLVAAPDDAPIERILPLLEHSSPDVRRRALRLVRARSERVPDETLGVLLRDPDPEVRVDAVHRLVRPSEDGALERIRGALADDDARVRAATMELIARGDGRDDESLVDEAFVTKLLAAGSEEMRAQVARSLGGFPTLDGLLAALLEDPSPAVVVGAIEGAGRARSRSHLPWIIGHVGPARHRKAARAALVAFGDLAVDDLVRALDTEDTPAGLRSHLPRVLADIGTRAAADALMQRIRGTPGLPAQIVVHALGKLRRNRPDVVLDGGVVLSAVRALVNECKILDRALDALPEESASRSVAFLRRVVLEKREDALEQAFGLLGLVHDRADMFSAYSRLSSSDRTLRASALEFLDNVLGREEKLELMPLLETKRTPSPASATPRVPLPMRSPRTPAIESALDTLAVAHDPWLRTVVAFAREGDTC